MSEKTPEEQEHDRDQLIASLSFEDFMKLTPAQFGQVQNARLQQMNKRARERIEEMFKGKMEDVARSLTEPPFTFKTPELTVMAGCKVRFTTLVMAQVRDAHRRLDEFMVREDPNNLRSSDFLNRELLAHSLFEFNGSDFGGVSFDPSDYQQLRSSKPGEAAEMLDEVRTRRLEAIDDLSPHLLDRLIEYYQGFQMTIEEMSRSDEMEETLGN